MQMNLVGFLISTIASFTILIIIGMIGYRAEALGDQLKTDALKLPLLDPNEENVERIDTITEMQRKWDIASIIWGLTYVPFFSGVFLISAFNQGSIVDFLFYMLFVIIIGLPSGIGRALWNRSFWIEQLNPIEGIQANLEKYMAAQLKNRPKAKPSRSWYLEVDMNVYTNYDTMMKTSLRHRLVELIVKRELSPDGRTILLEYLTRRDDLIGQVAREVQRGIPQRAGLIHNPN